MSLSLPLSVEQVQNLIHVVRGRRVIVDKDLAAIYDVPTHRFNEAVKRNVARFPADFRFQLTRAEMVALSSGQTRGEPEVTSREGIIYNSSQIAMSSRSNRGSAYLPWAFTEHGALMAANVLRSPRAVDLSVHVIRAFINLRDTMAVHRELTARLAELERKNVGYDSAISELCEAMRLLLASPDPPHDRKIGFRHP
ncbi:MAG: hypothetical protein RL324_2490 [Verrucomicrobiota bacterium]|jgi:hypothetical protein